MSRLTLTAAQENLIRNVLERNHSYYVDQGMSRSHMWPEELLSEIRNELEHVSRNAPEPGSPEEKVAEQSRPCLQLQGQRKMTDHVLAQILDKSRTARDGSFNVLSTGEKLAAALVLNRAEWLEKMDYTMAEAIERVGADWLARIPEAARVIAHEAEMGRVMSEWDSAVESEISRDDRYDVFLREGTERAIADRRPALSADDAKKHMDAIKAKHRARP